MDTTPNDICNLFAQRFSDAFSGPTHDPVVIYTAISYTSSNIIDGAYRGPTLNVQWMNA